MRLTPRLNPRLIALAAAMLMLTTAAALPLSVQGVTEGPWGVWRTEVVHDEASIFGYTVLQLDSKGNPHVLSSRNVDGEGASLWYSWHDGLRWMLERIESRSNGGSLVLDGHDRPHISHRVRVDGESHVNYTRRIGASWVSETVETRIDAGRTIIALDNSNRPHILYASFDPNLVLKHAVRDAPGWEITTLDAADRAGSNFAFTIDQKNRLHVAYMAADPISPDPYLTFRYMVRHKTDSWTRDVVYGCQTDIALTTDKEGHPHIACRHPGGLSYLHNDGVEWHNEMAATQGANPRVHKPPGEYVGFEPSIALDSHGRPHVTYWIVFNVGSPDNPLWPGQLHYGVKNMHEWVHEVVDHDGQLNGKGSSIQLDSKDRPKISYLATWRWYDPGPLTPLDFHGQIRYAEPLAATLVGPVGL